MMEQIAGFGMRLTIEEVVHETGADHAAGPLCFQRVPVHAAFMPQFIVAIWYPSVDVHNENLVPQRFLPERRIWADLVFLPIGVNVYV
jgi:hypothetical protein